MIVVWSRMLQGRPRPRAQGSCIGCSILELAQFGCFLCLLLLQSTWLHAKLPLFPSFNRLNPHWFHRAGRQPTFIQCKSLPQDRILSTHPSTTTTYLYGGYKTCRKQDWTFLLHPGMSRKGKEREEKRREEKKPQLHHLLQRKAKH